MGLPERKPEDQPRAEAEQKPALLDEKELFPGVPLPYREVDFVGADGKEGKLLVQALTMKELDEINHIQGQPVLDGRGNVVEEANQIGWDAKVIARAARHPNKTRMAVEHWQALAERIATQWLPGTIRKIRGVVLEISGFGGAREQEKKGS
jgi:hypothetical protein